MRKEAPVSAVPKGMGDIVRSRSLSGGWSAWTRSPAGSKPFAFVGSHYIITVEVAGPHSFIANVINLSDFVIVVQASDVIYKGGSGRYYIGQVFEEEHKDTARRTPEVYGVSSVEGEDLHRPDRGRGLSGTGSDRRAEHPDRSQALLP